jgi:hypothetical protein
VPPGERAALAAFLARDGVDLKRADARLLVRTIARRLSGAETWPPRRRVRATQTSLLYEYRREYVGRQIEGLHVADDLVVAFARILTPSFPALYRRVSCRCLALDVAAESQFTAAPPAQLLARFRRDRELLSSFDLKRWLERHHLSARELVATLRERDLEARVARDDRFHTRASMAGASLPARVARTVSERLGVPRRLLTRPLLAYPGIPWRDTMIREMKFRGTFATIAAHARRVLGHNAAVIQQHPFLSGAPVRRGLLISLVARRWRVDPDRVESEMLARGFTGFEDFAEAAQHIFVYERTSAGPYRSERLADCFHLSPESE